MTFSVKNFNKPSNKKLKAVADFFLYTLPLYMGAILAMPIPEEKKMWINAIITFVIVTIKGVTKFTSEETNIPENGDSL